jgi:predicted transcriptional regulator
MPSARFSVRISYIERPYSDDFERYIAWLCDSLGLCTHECDSASDVLMEIIKTKRGINSTELSRKLHKSRGAVINQLNKLIASGLVVKMGRFYRLRGSSVEHTIAELFDDIEHVFRRMMRIAKEIDKELERL